MSAIDVAALAAAAALALAHVGAWRLRFLEGLPRSWVLSAAGGVSVAYVFVHLLPEIAEGQEALAESTEGILPGLERHAYVLALVGLGVFYGVERAAVRSRRAAPDVRPSTVDEGERSTGAATFALALVSFAVYNALIGYLLVRRGEDHGVANLALFAFALGVHFVVNDFGLREHHKRRYHDMGRWLLAAAVLTGWAIGVTAEVSESAIAALVALVGGGVVLNVLKEELPEERASRFSAFAAGAAAYAVVLLTL